MFQKPLEYRRFLIHIRENTACVESALILAKKNSDLFNIKTGKKHTKYSIPFTHFVANEFPRTIFFSPVELNSLLL